MLKPKVGISACLLGRRVRYDGRDKFDPLPAEVLAGRIEWVPVCPEVESGLPVPREPIQLEGDPAAPELRGVRSHAELTGMMCAFCERRAAELDGLSGFVFKSRSPSCGLRCRFTARTALRRVPPRAFSPPPGGSGIPDCPPSRLRRCMTKHACGGFWRLYRSRSEPFRDSSRSPSAIGALVQPV